MISAYTTKDKQACIDLFLDVFKNEPWNYHWMTAQNMNRYFTDMENTPCFMGMTCIIDNQLIGFCLGVTSDYFVGKSFEIKEIVVVRALQGQGLGSQMLAEIERYLLKQGVEAITLATQHDIAAFSFYEKQGYQVSDNAVYLFKDLLV